ncbi:putative B3 domain-containing protein REM15 [Raphanus sativus]|uniref:B3 domain-containing protein REM14-like n=1 Tax=Raphanus sativus TaxID=3726 RepID=A0A9W3DLQ3_RAPSA|nr:B3 domain-containing protein REM14-like [Raphanus sativus]KAJ4902941.1 putative B3 domain-containing protein REM15 [Raphanus sativus]
MANQHFFKPLLPGFHSHLKIPAAFFSKHIEGRNEHGNIAKLRSDTSEITWIVKIEDGLRLTDGWKEFALAHDLRVGDIVIFRQEKDMAFHVTLFGPSCCEIQYGSCLETKNKLVEVQSKKQVKKDTKGEAESCTLLDPSCYVANVTPSSLRYDMHYIPKSFARANGLETRCGEIVLMNEKGTSWTLALKRKNSCGTMYLTRGWRRFCRINGLKAGSFFTFKLIQRGETLVLRKSPSSTESEDSSEDDEESNQDEKSFKKARSTWKPSSSPIQNLFLTLTLKPWDVKRSRLYLPLRFTRRHGINEETKMTMLDKNGVKWSTDPRSEKPSARIRLVGGWKEFFKANCVKIGESIMLRLIWEGDTSCILKFYSKVKQ